jgi:selenium metabolism protein YedF
MACPLPVVTTEKEYREMQVGESLSVVVDNEAAVTNLKRAVANWGGELTTDKQGNDYVLHITKTKAMEAHNATTGTVVIISSEAVERGDDELGKVLMRAFMTSMADGNLLPSHMIFLNSGVKLTTEGSPVLESLNRLIAVGVDVMSCGTCLDFYHLKEKLSVGRVTNFLEISRLALTADRCVNF